MSPVMDTEVAAVEVDVMEVVDLRQCSSPFPITSSKDLDSVSKQLRQSYEKTEVVYKAGQMDDIVEKCSGIARRQISRRVALCLGISAHQWASRYYD
jgi:hypothetical protein